MNEPLERWFSSSSDQEKIVFLAQLSHDLTIHGRAFEMDYLGKEQIAAFKGLNELQHGIAQHIAHLAAGTNRRSGDDIWQSLHGKAAHYRLSAHLRQSLERLAAYRDAKVLKQTER
jgi:hypothetical protein